MTNADKQASVGNIKALYKNTIFPVNGTDIDMESGTFLNAGAGWNNFYFDTYFEEPPVVFCQADGYTVEVKDITEKGFLYRLVVPVSSLGLSTRTFYTYKSQSSSYPLVYNLSYSSYTTPVTVLTGVNLDGGSGTTGEALEIRYLALEQIV